MDGQRERRYRKPRSVCTWGLDGAGKEEGGNREDRTMGREGGRDGGTREGRLLASFQTPLHTRFNCSSPFDVGLRFCTLMHCN